MPILALLHGDKTFDKLGPLNAGIGLDDTSRRIEAKLVMHRARVDHYRSARELLAAHGMTAARNRNRLSVTPGRFNCSPQCCLGVDGNNTINACLVELRMDVVDQCAGTLRGDRS